MNLLLLVAKIAVVAFFLVRFLRGSRLVWGIGLLTVTSALLLDTFLNTFGREEALEQLGFFFYVVSGSLFAGAALWLWGLLRPLLTTAGALPVGSSLERRPDYDSASWPAAANPAGNTTFDRHMLVEQIRLRFGPEDVYDLIFDLGMSENDVLSPNQTLNQTVLNIVDLAEGHGQGGNLALAVERILTPVPSYHLPRPEKLSAESPRTILRHYLIANTSREELRGLAADLEVDWDMITGGGKRAEVRNLLLHLYRRDRIGELIDQLRSREAAGAG